jgi:hypothetical protein
MIHAVGINMEQNNQENNKLLFGKLEGLRNTKRGFWVCFSDKSKKRGGETSGWKGRPQDGPSSLRKLFLPFFLFFLSRRM